MTRQDPTRQQMIERAVTLRAEIELHFQTYAHWNDNVRKPDEQPIDPDPDGQLLRIAAGIDRMLATEKTR
jgi:hypothetical protein